MANISDFLMEVDTNIKLSDVILSDENKEKVDLFIRENKNRDKLIKYGLTPVNRLLLYGASGTGKTYLTKALANTLGLKLLYIDIAKALSDNYVAQNMSDVFEIAREYGNCIVFLDECDSITMSRYNQTYDDTSVVRRATNSLFQQLDQMDPRTVFVAATNLLFKIDPAFERRMNLKLEFRRPTELRKTINKFTFPTFEIVDDLNKDVEAIVNKRAANYVKLSYYEIQGIVERAMKDAVLNNTDKIYLSKIYDDLSNAMGVKLRFDTHKEEEKAFEHPIDTINY